ncbi:MAG: response regulator [Planctomycetota bacterium]
MSVVHAIVADLMFGSKVAATARAHGVDYRGARSLAGLREAAGSARLVIVDLEAELPDGDPVEAIGEALARTPSPRVIAFAGHLATERLEAARRAGAHEVLSRGGFSQRLEGLMAVASTDGEPSRDQ